MSAVQITGISGAGKSAITILARRGLASIDADDDPLLARSVDAVGNVGEDTADPAIPSVTETRQASPEGDPSGDHGFVNFDDRLRKPAVLA
jgi:hypothetical protein